MPSGTSDSPLTTKTEFARYLDAHPDSVPQLRKVSEEYKRTKPTGTAFGLWARSYRYNAFSAAYHGWWLKHPKLYGKVYQEQDLLAVSSYR